VWRILFSAIWSTQEQAGERKIGVKQYAKSVLSARGEPEERGKQTLCICD
jgi:hypothetical protein